MRKKLYCCSDYEVDSDGYILSKRFNKPLKHSVNPQGYQIVTIQINKKKVAISVHIAVARAFIEGYKPELQVNHKDGNKQNNKYNNLEWVTGKENMRHAVDILNRLVGANNPAAKSIACFDKITGKLLKVYDSISYAAKNLCTNNDNYRYTENSIWRVLKGHRKTYKGYVWNYYDAKLKTT